jgi:hypothetical protein
MKPKEDIPLKCALAGGVAGLFLGLVDALITVNEHGAGLITLLDASLSLLLWIFSLAIVGGGGAFFVLWLAERKFGSPAEDTGPDAILQKASYLRALHTETHKAYLDIGNHVASANQHLTAAEKEFTAGAFAPFWDEIEHAANELAAYKNEVEHMRRSVEVYKTEAVELERLSVPAPPLDLAGRPLPDARPAAARFAVVVRKAQTNFQFAVIFEQRKTNQLLHAGFGNLGAAIYSLGDSINASINTLSKSLNSKMDKILLEKLLTGKADKAEKAEKADKEDAAKLREERQREQAEALDRIQHNDGLL